MSAALSPTVGAGTERRLNVKAALAVSDSQQLGPHAWLSGLSSALVVADRSAACLFLGFTFFG
jgi:hypothetical protein